MTDLAVAGTRAGGPGRRSTIADLESALGGIPDLDGAACKGRTEWDADDPADPMAAEAVAGCRVCPALGRCRGWLASLPPHERPRGVVAGQVVLPPPRPRPPKPKPKPKPRQPRKPKIQRCTEWLAGRLGGGGAVAVRDVNAEGAALGFSRTELHIAADRLGVVRTGSVHAARGGPGRPHWRLPGGTETPQTSTEATEPPTAVDRRDVAPKDAQDETWAAGTDDEQETA